MSLDWIFFWKSLYTWQVGVFSRHQHLKHSFWPGSVWQWWLGWLVWSGWLGSLCMKFSKFPWWEERGGGCSCPLCGGSSSRGWSHHHQLSVAAMPPPSKHPKTPKIFSQIFNFHFCPQITLLNSSFITFIFSLNTPSPQMWHSHFSASKYFAQIVSIHPNILSVFTLKKTPNRCCHKNALTNLPLCAWMHNIPICFQLQETPSSSNWPQNNLHKPFIKMFQPKVCQTCFWASTSDLNSNNILRSLPKEKPNLNSLKFTFIWFFHPLIISWK